jgi:hypothetical protein
VSRAFPLISVSFVDAPLLFGPELHAKPVIEIRKGDQVAPDSSFVGRNEAPTRYKRGCCSHLLRPRIVHCFLSGKAFEPL